MISLGTRGMNVLLLAYFSLFIHQIYLKSCANLSFEFPLVIVHLGVDYLQGFSVQFL